MGTTVDQSVYRVVTSAGGQRNAGGDEGKATSAYAYRAASTLAAGNLAVLATPSTSHTAFTSPDRCRCAFSADLVCILPSICARLADEVVESPRLCHEEAFA